VGIVEAVAVKSAWQSAYTPADAARFANAYDKFWENLGGVPMIGPLWRIALPYQPKALSDVSAKHRKRAAQRRAYWQGIGESARLAIAVRRQ
jgi:uncharacterized protein VirK/YbjX